MSSRGRTALRESGRPAVRSRLARRLAAGLAALALALAPAAAAAAPGSQEALLQAGKDLYGRYCIACHGTDGAGVRPGSGDIGFAPGRAEGVQQGAGPPLAGVGAQAADFYLHTGYMPLRRVGEQPARRDRPFFQPSDMAALIAYVASLGSGPSIPVPHPGRGDISEGQRLFTEHCAGCHQAVARGGYVTGATAFPLQRATATQIAEAVRIGPYVMPTFSERQISDRQLDSIVGYVLDTRHPANPGGLPIGNIGPVPEGFIAWVVGGTALVIACIAVGTRFRREG
jgi:quinol---cytochrome-c reductase cytochrome c subunit